MVHNALVNELTVSAKQRRALQSIADRPSAAAGLVRRARVVLLSADGIPCREIATRLDLSAEAVSRIRRRFVEGGVDGLLDRPKAGRKDHAVPSSVVEEILQLSMSPPPAGRARWTTRLLAARFGITSGAVLALALGRDPPG
jgi:transposase